MVLFKLLAEFISLTLAGMGSRLYWCEDWGASEVENVQLGMTLDFEIRVLSLLIKSKSGV